MLTTDMARIMTYDPHDVIEFFEERSAVREYDGVMPRKVAEGYALQDVRERYGRGAEQMVIRHRESDKK